MPARSLRLCTCTNPWRLAVPARPRPGRSHVPAAASRPVPAGWVPGPRWCGCRPAVVAAAGQCLQRLVRQRGQVRVCAGDVGRVGNDGVEHALHPMQPVAVFKAHGQAQPLRVGLGHRQGVGAGIHRQHLGRGPLALQASAMAPLPVPRSATRGAGRGGRWLPAPSPPAFRCRGGVQHAGIHLQRQAIELLAPR